MNCSRMLAAIGLALDLSGALLLWKYGLPENPLAEMARSISFVSSKTKRRWQKHGGTTAGLLLLCA